MPATPVFSSSLPADSLAGYVERLLANHLPDGIDPGYDLTPHVATALERVEHSFSNIHRKYYEHQGSIAFDHLNGDHMAAFLYLLGNSAWAATGDSVTPTKLFYLNKVMHALDLYFSVALPEIFLLVHPVGSVIGNAHYGDYFVVYQNCTIGADNGIYPHFGEGTVLYSRSSVLGNCTVGDNVVFAANSFVVNHDVPADSIVVGQYPSQRALPNPTTVRERIFDPASA